MILRLLKPVSYSSAYYSSMAEDVFLITLILVIALCILSVAGILLFTVHRLSKSNDYGDEDTMGLRKGFAEEKNIGSSMGTELSLGSAYCMKNFRYDEVTKK